MVGPSLLCAVDLRTYATVTSNLDIEASINIESTSPIGAKLELRSDMIGKYTGHYLDYVHAACKVIHDRHPITKSINIKIESIVPAGSGLSSSAAVIMATLGSLNSYYRLGLSTDELSKLAYMVEHQELRTGAGKMDFIVCGLGGLIYIDSIESPISAERLSFPDKGRLIIIDTQNSRSTASVIAHKRKRYLNQEPLIMKYVSGTKQIVDQMRNEFITNETRINLIGRYISDCHQLLRDYMAVSTNLIEEVISICMDNGALGAKLTGTGMGGCLFAFAEANSVDNIVIAVNKLPIVSYICKVDTYGLRYEK